MYLPRDSLVSPTREQSQPTYLPTAHTQIGSSAPPLAPKHKPSTKGHCATPTNTTPHHLDSSLLLPVSTATTSPATYIRAYLPTFSPRTYYSLSPSLPPFQTPQLPPLTHATTQPENRPTPSPTTQGKPRKKKRCYTQHPPPPKPAPPAPRP